MLALGPAVLTEAELLALLLGTGYQGMSVTAMASHLLEQFDGLEKLLTSGHQRLMMVKGLGPAKATQLGAILELCRRVLDARLAKSDIISSPEVTREYLQLHFQGLEREQFACLFLDTRHRVIALETLFMGTLSAAAVYPREVVKQALAVNAGSVILCHNHPSGDPQPSQADIQITARLKEALQLVDIQVLDHMIVGRGSILSMAEHGLV